MPSLLFFTLMGTRHFYPGPLFYLLWICLPTFHSTALYLPERKLLQAGGLWMDGGEGEKTGKKVPGLQPDCSRLSSVADLQSISTHWWWITMVWFLTEPCWISRFIRNICSSSKQDEQEFEEQDFNWRTGTGGAADRWNQLMMNR